MSTQLKTMEKIFFLFIKLRYCPILKINHMYFNLQKFEFGWSRMQSQISSPDVVRDSIVTRDV